MGMFGNRKCLLENDDDDNKYVLRMYKKYAHDQLKHECSADNKNSGGVRYEFEDSK